LSNQNEEGLSEESKKPDGDPDAETIIDAVM